MLLVILFMAAVILGCILKIGIKVGLILLTIAGVILGITSLVGLALVF